MVRSQRRIQTILEGIVSKTAKALEQLVITNIALGRLQTIPNGLEGQLLRNDFWNISFLNQSSIKQKEYCCFVACMLVSFYFFVFYTSFLILFYEWSYEERFLLSIQFGAQYSTQGPIGVFVRIPSQQWKRAEICSPLWLYVRPVDCM
jgi:hypothetical protein